MKFQLFFFFSFFLLVNTAKAKSSELTSQEIQLISNIRPVLDSIAFDSVATRAIKFKRGKAIVFTLLTGFFGGHRIYFGTHHRTPIIYSITFGGLGILPLIDLAHIIFTKDLSRYEHKSQIIMWGK